MVPVGWETYFERLGPLGLHCLLTSLLTEADVEAIADRDVSRLEPAERARLVADRIVEQPALREALLARLDERAAATPLDPPPEEWDASQVRERLARMLRSPGPDAARVLHRLARSARPPLPGSELRATAEILAPVALDEEAGTRPKYVAKVASDRAGIRELQQQRRELEGRVRQLEGQLTRALEHSATLEDTLARRLEEQRGLRSDEKEAREERQRLEKELARLRKRIDDLNERRARERTGEITTALRKLTTEQRRAHASLDKLHQLEKQQVEAFRGQGRELVRLNELLERMLALQEAASRTGAAAQEAILLQLATLSTALVGGENGKAAADAASTARGSTNGKPRVGVFVDVQNMFYGAREKRARLDFDTLLAAATSGRQLVRAVAYLVEAPEIDQRAFIHLLQMKAYEVKRKPLRIRPDRSMKGNWDLEMALDALTTSEHLDVVVLVTGDGDFVPLVRQLKLSGLRVEVYGFTKSSAPDLREAADKFVPITRRFLRPLDAGRRAARKTAKAGRRRAKEKPDKKDAPAAKDARPTA